MDFRSALCCVSGSDWRKRGKRGSSSWRIFSLKELQMATNNFNYDNKLGEGGFGSVYWGQLWDGSQIAVKRLKSWNGDNAELDFCVEVEILARIRHKNLLPLRGYCAEGQERLIVYNYVSNLSLQSHLHGTYSSECNLDWERRMNIAVGIAHGIAYLHHSRVIHRDIKASNVLLDDDFHPRLADFGFAKFIPRGDTPVSALGYLAPEYELSGKASESCDVYSFGILLLELFTGRRPVEKANSTSKRRIAEWALPLAREGRFEELADARLEGKYAEEEMKRGVLIGLLCSQNRPEKRPRIDQVVELLLKGDGDKFADLENSEVFMGL